MILNCTLSTGIIINRWQCNFEMQKPSPTRWAIFQLFEVVSENHKSKNLLFINDILWLNKGIYQIYIQVSKISARVHMLVEVSSASATQFE